jgi:hypothetical protein
MILIAGIFSQLEQGLQDAFNWVVKGVQDTAHVLVPDLFTAFHAAFPHVDISAYQTDFNQLDYCFPLSELITLLVGWLAFYFAVFLYRLGKSWLWGS